MYTFICDECNKEMNSMCSNVYGTKRICDKCLEFKLRKEIENEKEVDKFVCDGCGWTFEFDQGNEYEYGLKSLCNGCYETQIEEDRQNGEY